MVLWESVAAGDRSDCRYITDYDGDLLAGLMPVASLLPAMTWNKEFRIAHPGGWDRLR
ncbi:hypothetical protein [Asanoa ferruginea]|nr:hypothetical protein [Asanoa ferruginea]